jgi:site-specific DNA-methyltransferase (adenine-specific)
MQTDIIYNLDCIKNMDKIDDNSIHLILSDIPYGIGIDDWDVLHDNKNSAYLGSSPAQQKAGNIFKKRGKPLNGWSEADKQIPVQYYQWCLSWTKLWFDKLVPCGNVFIFAGRRLAHRCICAMEDAGFTFKDMIAWNKQKAPLRAQHISSVFDRRGDLESASKWIEWRVGNLRPVFEPILWFTKPYPIGTTIADNIMNYGVGAFNETALSKYCLECNNLIPMKSLKSDTGLHTTQKPLDLMKILIELTTVENQIVLDPFAGSGTTLLAAKQLNRKYIGFETNKEYYDIANHRLGMY